MRIFEMPILALARNLRAPALADRSFLIKGHLRQPLESLLERSGCLGEAKKLYFFDAIFGRLWLVLENLHRFGDVLSSEKSLAYRFRHPKMAQISAWPSSFGRRK